MNLIMLLTPWTGTGTETDPYRPLARDVFALASWVDFTHQACETLMPDPNLLAIEARCDDLALAAIEADGRFLVLSQEVI
jgi:hypothetical protein